ncbi:MAG: hypothetical protein D6736_06135 [Nitrospinota bacterium]|nr:MAG: hypothetical protein D6736_06135 [Nitrospinota bacterium]
MEVSGPGWQSIHLPWEQDQRAAQVAERIPVRVTATRDRVSLSEQGKETGREASGQPAAPQQGGGRGLDPREERIVEELRQRDQEVRAHEQAHLMAAGRYARGGPRFTYQIGPDGKRYAVSGEVPIDVSPVPGDPEATIQKAATIRRAALAPAHPSSADLAIAARAAQMAAQAQQELLQARSEHRVKEAALTAEGKAGTIADPGTTPITPPQILIEMVAYQQNTPPASLISITV